MALFVSTGEPTMKKLIFACLMLSGLAVVAVPVLTAIADDASAQSSRGCRSSNIAKPAHCK
jgi:hypothetical protein